MANSIYVEAAYEDPINSCVVLEGQYFGGRLTPHTQLLLPMNRSLSIGFEVSKYEWISKGRMKLIFKSEDPEMGSWLLRVLMLPETLLLEESAGNN